MRHILVSALLFLPAPQQQPLPCVDITTQPFGDQVVWRINDAFKDGRRAVLVSEGKVIAILVRPTMTTD